MKKIKMKALMSHQINNRKKNQKIDLTQISHILKVKNLTSNQIRMNYDLSNI